MQAESFLQHEKKEEPFIKKGKVAWSLSLSMDQGSREGEQPALLFDTDADQNLKTRKQNIKEKKKKKTGVAEVQRVDGGVEAARQISQTPIMQNQKRESS